MNKWKYFLERLLLLSPDSGDGGGDAGGDSGSDVGDSGISEDSSDTITDTKEDKDQPAKESDKGKEDKGFDLSNANKKNAAFVSQLSKENQSIEFGEKITKLDDLVDDWKNLNEKSKNSIAIPTKDSSEEEVKSFLEKMGVPESADKYDLPQGKLPDNQYPEIKEIFMKEAFNSALSKGQASNMWNMVNAHFSAQNQMIEQMNENVKETFSERFDKELEKESTDPAARKEIATEYANLFKDLVMNNEDFAIFKEHGFNYNPKIIIALAKYNKAMGNDSFSNGTSRVNGSASKSPFGESFKKAYGK